MKTSTILRIFRSRTHVAMVTGALMFALACDKIPEAAGAEAASDIDRKEARHTDRDVENLKKAEQIWAKSLTSGDPKLLATLIDPEFTFIGPDGEYEERTAYLAGYEQLPKLGVEVQSIDIRDSKFRVLGNVGIVTGRVLAKVKMQAQPMTEDVRFTRVYRRSTSGWQMVAGQGTRIAAGAPGAEPPR